MNSHLDHATETINIEIEGLSYLKNNLSESFSRACERILEADGRVVVTGMGKSGHIGKKISASLASTGTPSFFMHPAEAAHGDLGMLTREDVVLAISNSGNAGEIMQLVPFMQRLGIPLITMTAKADSLLGNVSDIILNIAVPHEACPHNLAPTTSTTATLALGDALTIALLKARGFTEEDFAVSHPAGTLGKRLLLTVADLMHQGPSIPRVPETATFSETLLEMTAKKLGMTIIEDARHHIIGIFTDGDLRRALERGDLSRHTPINSLMTAAPLTISPDELAVRALNMMEDKQITTLIVSRDQARVDGVLHLHDLLKSGIV